MLNHHKILILAFLFVCSTAVAQRSTNLRNICRVKGQEENVLRGFGLVVGLNGTGEANDLATMRALHQSLEVMGNPVSTTGRFDESAIQALRRVKNVAMVIVTATVPATGSRSGDKLDCHVSALNGKSLVGGRLAFASLQGPNTLDKRVFALCNGAVQVEDIALPTVGYIHNGCQMERDIFTPFATEEGWVTFVLDNNHADFVVASRIAEKLADSYKDQYFAEENVDFDKEQHNYVKAIDATNIQVLIPPAYKEDQVIFIADILDTTINEIEPEARVVINPRKGSIVISGDVAIGDVVITHKNLSIEVGVNANVVSISPGQSNLPKLDKLVEALSNLKVPAEDKIEIIRGIDRMGKLHAKLIVL